MMIWAWEFLRRNPEFRDFWVHKVEPFVTTDGRVWPHYKEMRRIFGIVDPGSPRQNLRIPPFDVLATKFAEAPAISYERLPAQADATGPFVRPSRANISQKTILKNAQLDLSWFEMGFVIDLSLPLDDQLKAIRILAEKDQTTLISAGHVDPVPARKSGKYLLYLRILDAEDAGAPRSEIETALFQGLDNDYERGRPRSKAFDNARCAARRLRDSGYRALACRAKAPLDVALN
jgi:hypothetical protein